MLAVAPHSIPFGRVLSSYRSGFPNFTEHRAHGAVANNSNYRPVTDLLKGNLCWMVPRSCDLNTPADSGAGVLQTTV